MKKSILSVFVLAVVLVGCGIGDYWSSMTNLSNSEYAYRMTFYSGGASVGGYDRNNGYSVRCVLE